MQKPFANSLQNYRNYRLCCHRFVCLTEKFKFNVTVNADFLSQNCAFTANVPRRSVSQENAKTIGSYSYFYYLLLF